MKFFFDNNLSKHLVEGIKAFGENVIHLTDKFSENEQDVSWLRYIGENKMVLITRDERLRWNPAEIVALKKYKVGAFFLGGKKLSKCTIIQQVIKNWPRIKELAIKKRNKVPYAFRVPSRGTKITPLNI